VRDLVATEAAYKRCSSSMRGALRWVIDHKRWDVLDQVHEKRRDQLQGDPKLLYCVASAFARAGRADESENLATAAFEMRANAAARVLAAAELANLGSVDWAEREY